MREVAERFLREERAHSGPRIDPVDRARFHRLVTFCTELWNRHARTGLRMTRGKQGISLLFDGPIGGRNLALFSLRVDYKRGEYRFNGPNADRERMGLNPESLELLERLRDLYAALLVEGPTTDLAITATLRGKPFPDLLPLVEETRRVLDGGHDGTAARILASRSGKKKHGSSGPNGKGQEGQGESGESTEPRLMSLARIGLGSRTITAPTMTTIQLSCPEPKDSAAFFRRIFGVKSLPKSRPDDHAVYEMGGVTVVLRRELSAEERRVMGYGTVQRNRGWGMAIGIAVPDFEACLRRVKRVPDALIEADPEGRTMLVREPAGYVLEVSASE